MLTVVLPEVGRLGVQSLCPFSGSPQVIGVSLEGNFSIEMSNCLSESFGNYFILSFAMSENRGFSSSLPVLAVIF